MFGMMKKHSTLDNYGLLQLYQIIQGLIPTPVTKTIQRLKPDSLSKCDNISIPLIVLCDSFHLTLDQVLVHDRIDFFHYVRVQCGGTGHDPGDLYRIKRFKKCQIVIVISLQSSTNTHPQSFHCPHCSSARRPHNSCSRFPRPSSWRWCQAFAY